MVDVNGAAEGTFDPFQTVFGYFLHKTSRLIFDGQSFTTPGGMALGVQKRYCFLRLSFLSISFYISIFRSSFNVLGNEMTGKPILSQQFCGTDKEEIH